MKLIYLNEQWYGVAEYGDYKVVIKFVDYDEESGVLTWDWC